MKSLRGYPVRIRRVFIDGRSFEIAGPANYESLVDDPRVAIRFAQDEFMPYWAEFWPACVLLAEEVARWPVAVPAADGSRPVVLEFGCGLGLPSLVALSRGYSVIASDYEDDALAFVLASAELNRLPAPETRFIDWRQTYPGLKLDRIIAAEVLYEKRNLEPIARFIRRHLKAGGLAQIIDGNRGVADAFPEVARSEGLTVEESSRSGLDAEARPVVGRVFTVS